MNLPAIHFHDFAPGPSSLREEVLAALSQRPLAIAPKFFYDERGSQLFDAICTLPEYYLTRTETGILQRHAREIARLVGPEAVLVELGSGASRKVRLLLAALQPSTYLGIDISREFLLTSTRKLAQDFPWLEVHAACADFTRHLDITRCPDGAHRLAFFPGSSIGNFEPEPARKLLEDIAALVGPNGQLLIGVDLKKDPTLLHRAYNDARGITAEFNRNLLVRMRRELEADVDPQSFDHYAFYNPTPGRIEMHLVSRRAQAVRIDGRVFAIAEGESIHTESSYKYTVDQFHGLASAAGFDAQRVWQDENRLFSLQLLRAR